MWNSSLPLSIRFRIGGLPWVANCARLHVRWGLGQPQIWVSDRRFSDERASHRGRRKQVSTGIAGLDNVLCGGLDPDRLYLVEGEPGTGKTTLALQFLLEGARLGERGLYVTLSESEDELRLVAKRHGWSLDDISVFELVPPEAALDPEKELTLFHPSELELSETSKMIFDRVTEIHPPRVVFDSLSEMRLLAQNSLRYRRQILALKHFFA